MVLRPQELECLKQDIQPLVFAYQSEKQDVALVGRNAESPAGFIPVHFLSEMVIKRMLYDAVRLVPAQFKQVLSNRTAECDGSVQAGQEVFGERSVEKALLVGDNIVQNAHNLAVFPQSPADIAQGRPEPGHPVAYNQYVRPPFAYFLGGTDVCYRICRVQNCLTRNLLRGVFLRDILSLAREKQFRILS